MRNSPGFWTIFSHLVAKYLECRYLLPVALLPRVRTTNASPCSRNTDMLDHQKDDDDNEVCAPMAKPPDADALNETAVGLFLDALNGTKPRGNVLYSPLGVASALAAASRGRAMPGFAPANDHVVATLRELLPCDQLKLGNLLHLDPRTSLSKEYQTFFEEGLAGKIIRTPKDSKVAEDVPASTNRWATQLTDGAVTHVIDVIDVLEEPDLPTASSPPPSADEETSIKSATHDDLCKRVGCPAYLVNLVHICSHWEEGFGRVMPHPFYEHPQKASIVAMMTRRSEFPYLRQDGYSCLRVPMACKANMSLFLPTLRSGLDDVLPVFSSWKQLKCVLDRAVWTTDVTLTLPKVRCKHFVLARLILSAKYEVLMLTIYRTIINNQQLKGTQHSFHKLK